MPRWPTFNTEWDRFMSHVEPEGDCLMWTGPVNDQGYGLFVVEHRHIRAHRYAYEHLVGPIPDGLPIDHTCHNADPSCAGGPTCRHRRCVRTDGHLEPVTHLENVRRSPNTGNRDNLGRRQRLKTQCPQGHPYDAANASVSVRGHRTCRACARDRMYEKYQPKRARHAQRRGSTNVH